MNNSMPKMAASSIVAFACALVAAGAASAAWEPAKQVDNQGSGAGATGDYVAVADGGNGLSTAFFEQTVASNGYYAIRRGAADAGWGAPAPSALPGSLGVVPLAPVSAAADAAGNALSALDQIDSGFDSIFTSAWPAGAAGPSAYTELMKGSPMSAFADPELAFDSAGNGYAVAGEGSASNSTTDQPIDISTYSPSTGKWTTPTPIANKAGAADCTSGQICGQEPRLAVSRDGTVVIAYLNGCSSNIPTMTSCTVSAVRAEAGSVSGSGGAGSFSTPQRITQSADSVSTSSQGTPAVNFDVAIDGRDIATIVDAESGPANFANGTAPTDQVWATRWLRAPTSTDSGLSGGVHLSTANPPAGADWPRVVADGDGDATAVWMESSMSSPPPADVLMSAEVINSSWTSGGSSGAAPENVTGSSSADSPNAIAGYPVNTPPFSLAEDASGNAYVVWTNGGAVQAATRRPATAWSTPDTVSSVSGAVAGTARVATGMTGQADALVVGSASSRNALFATRFTGLFPPAAPSAPAPQPVTPANPPRNPGNYGPHPCYARPVSRILAGRAHASRKGIVVAGTASEHKCKSASAADAARNHVVKVYVTIYRPAPHGQCKFVMPSGKLSAPRACTSPIEYATRGTTSWSLRLHIHLAPVAGGYLVRSDAVDGFGRHSPRSAASVTHVVVRPKRSRRH